MEHLLLIIIGILLLIVFVLLAKVWFLRKSAQEIREAFHDRLAADTNTLIDISTRDPYMRKLAADINTQLRLLRKERHRYQQGDLELKEAVTNISHDLRTPLTAINGYLDLLEREEKSETVQRYLSQIQNRSLEEPDRRIVPIQCGHIFAGFETGTHGCCPGVRGKSAVILCGHAGERHPTGNRITGGTGLP